MAIISTVLQECCRRCDGIPIGAEVIAISLEGSVGRHGRRTDMRRDSSRSPPRGPRDWSGRVSIPGLNVFRENDDSVLSA